MSAHNHDEEIQKQFSGKPRPPKPEETTGKQSVEKKGEYIAEKTKYGEWTAHFHRPITGLFLSHVQQSTGIDQAQALKRHSMMIHVARMHQDDAANVIANAIESFKE